MTKMKTSIKASLIATAIATLPFGSHAAGLGSIHVFSGIGQPLRAEVELNVSPEELQTMSARVAPPEAFRQASLQYTPALSALRFSVERRGNRPVVRISSDRPFNEPFIDLLIELNWAAGRLVREYTFLLDPVPPGAPAPVIGSGGPAAASPVAAPPVTPAQRMPAAEPRAAASAEGERYQIKKGDTLHRIAETNRPDGTSLDQMLVALFRGNPDAFEGDNINRLRAGSIVTMPDAVAVRAIDPVQARREVQAQSADFSAFRRKLAGTVASRPPAPEQAPSRGDTGAIVPRLSEPPRTGGGDEVKVSGGPSSQATSKDAARLERLQALEEELAARGKALDDANSRVAALEANVRQMQQLLQMRSENLAQKQQEATPAANAPAAVAPPPTAKAPEQPAAPAASPVPPSPAPEAAKPARKPDAAPAPKAEPGLLQSLAGDPAVLAGGGGIVALLLAYAGLKLRQRRKLDQGPHDGNAPVSEFPPVTNSVFGGTGGQSVNTGESSVLHTDFSQSGLSAIDTDEGVDPVAEADVYMAYGRDAQAEEILLDALKTDSSRTAIYLKLLEIYSQRKNLKSFESTATELYSRTGGEGHDWEKAAEMGRRLDPENPLYRAAPAAGGGFATMSGVAAAAASVAAVSAPTGEVLARSPDEDAIDLDFVTSLDVESPPGLMASDGDSGANTVQMEALPEVDPDALDFDLDAGLNLGSQTSAEEVEATSAPALPVVDMDDAESLEVDLDIGDVGDTTPPATIEQVTPAADPMLATVIGGGLDFASADNALEFDLASPPDEVPDAPVPGEVSLNATVIGSDVAEAAETGEGDLEKTSFDSSLLDFDFNLEDAGLQTGSAPESSVSPPPLDLAGIDLNLESTVAGQASDDIPASDDFDLALPDSMSEGAVPAADVLEEVNTKLELARAYEEMGDTEGARELIDEVLREGSPEQREAAAKLAERLG